MNHPIPFEQTAEQSPAPEMSKSELWANEHALRLLQEAVGGLERGSPAPRERRALAAAFVVAVLGALVLPYAASRWMAVGAQVLTTLVLSGGVYLAYMVRSRAPSTWAEVLDIRLAAYSPYSPYSREAFLGLQCQLQEAGYIEVAIVRSWLDCEAERFSSAVKRLYGAPASRFLQRQI